MPKGKAEVRYRSDDSASRRSDSADDEIKAASESSNHLRDPFASSHASSVFDTPRNNIGYSSTIDVSGVDLHERIFRSRRIKAGSVDRVWTRNKDRKEIWSKIIPLVCLFLGFGLVGLLVWDGLRSVPHHDYCLILNEDFSNGINEDIWTKEVQLGGYGNGQFEYTTGDDENVFVQDSKLYIKPTLQDETLMQTNNTLNLTALGTCTSKLWTDCWTSTNTTNGSVINPVKSGRINTKKGAAIKYGRVEVVVELPAGDWLWPAVWLLPVDNVYGPWPASGEIDIVESRGNNYTYPGGSNMMSSTLHWGPSIGYDAWPKTFGNNYAWHTQYPSGKYTFGLEWSEDYLYTYVDSRLAQVLYTKFSGPLYQRGGFPPATGNGTRLVDPWTQTGISSTPFDQNFYLIINLAVGGTNNWFPDGLAQKPWVDASPTAKRDFWNARSQWYPTWQQGAGAQMVIHSVKMWQQKGYNGC